MLVAQHHVVSETVDNDPPAELDHRNLEFDGQLPGEKPAWHWTFGARSDPLGFQRTRPFKC